MQILLQLLPILLLIGVWIFFMRQMQGGARGAMGFGKSKARLLTENKNRVTFEDVAGVDEAKEDLTEIVDFLKDPAKFQRLGGKIPKGALLVGPPGTGKTLLGRAVAGEAGVPFFYISGSDFVEMFVGVGASRVRDMFEQAKKNAPCIIFIDEIDAVGRHRGAGLGGGNDEREQTLNQLLVEMDGFDPNEGIIVIASTNRPDVLDPALLRPGRFDRQVVVPNPDVGRPREDPARPHAQRAPGLRRRRQGDRPRHARLLRRRPRQPGQRGGADGRAARTAAWSLQRDFEDAKDKVMMGAERKSMVMSDEEKRNDRLSRGRPRPGGALACPPPTRCTRRPSSRAAWRSAWSCSCPRATATRWTYEQMTSRLAIMMGGRVAEELIFGKEKVTSGASSDIPGRHRPRPQHGDPLGLLRALGTVSYGDNQEEVFLGHSVARTQNVSEDTAQKIDFEVRRLVQAGHDEARRILTERLEDLHTLAKALLEFETLTGEEIVNVLKGVKPQPRRARARRRRAGPRVSVPLAPAGPDPRTARPLEDLAEPRSRAADCRSRHRPNPAGHGDRQRHAGQLLRRRAVPRRRRPRSRTRGG